MRRAGIALCFLACLLAGSAALRAQEPRGQRAPNTAVFRLVFGLKDAEPTDWTGELEPREAVRSQEPWRFLMGDALQGPGRWRLQTRLANVEPNPIGSPGMPAGRGKQAPWPAGVVVTFDEPAPATVRVHTAQGDFDFRPADLTPGDSRELLGGRARVERLPAPLVVAETTAYEDYPAAAEGPGGVWVAYTAYENGQDRVMARRLSQGAWDAPEAVAGPGDLYHPAVAADGSKLYVVWAARDGTNWDLWGRSREATGWSAPERLTTSPEGDLEPHLVAQGTGGLVLVWRGFRDGQTRILARRYQGGRWGSEERVSDGDGNCWDPAVAADDRGDVAVAWDTYAKGSYDVRLRWLRKDRWEAPRAIADSPLFEAHPSLAFFPGTPRLFIAWDESGLNWGKDTGFLFRGGTRLYEGRRIRIAELPDGRGPLLTVEAPQGERDLHSVLPENSVSVCELPQLAFDGNLRLCLFFRRRVARNPRMDGWAAQGTWEIYLTTLGREWSTPVALARSIGRNDMRVAVAPGSGGSPWIAYGTDNRTYQTPAPRNNDVMLARLPELRTGRLGLHVGGEPFAPSRIEGAVPVHRDEAADVARVRKYRIANGGKSYRILRGDLHRHTDTSLDGVGDGSLEDLYRYALDAAAFDYILVTDHNDGNDAEYPWWRREKSNDQYYAAGRFVPLYGYERSVAYPNGHRNVLLAERGTRTLPISPDEQQGRVNTGSVLYPYLRQNRGITTSHTSATSQGTDWRDNDPALEPMVEIFQGFHTAYEAPGAPKSVDERTGLIHGGFEPAGYVWNALAKGLRLGFQASSDHVSTHVSYACVITDDYSRQGILDAFRQRHCYAATDNIVLDVRSDGHLMGDEFTAPRVPPLQVRILGTAPISQVDVIRNEKVVYSTQPGRSDVQLRFLDTDAGPGAWHYYVRVVQADGQMAWASPIWITVK